MKTIPSKVFIDTNIFVATRDIKDSTHKRAKKLLTLLEESSSEFYTSSDVVGETCTVLSQKLGRSHATNFLKEIDSFAHLIYISRPIHLRARKLFIKTKSKNISFVDCSSVVVMKKNNIEYAFTFDKHFDKLGVKLLKAR